MKSRSTIQLHQLLSDANSASTFQNLLAAYTWQRSTNGYRAKEHGSYALYRKGGNWLFSAHNGDFKGGNPLQIAAELNNLDLKTAEGLHESARLVCQAAQLNFANYCSDEAPQPQENRPPQYKKPVTTKAWLPNAGKEETEQSFKSYALATKDSDNYQMFAQFYTAKTGVPTDQLEQHGVFPLASLTHWNGKEQIFAPNQLARLYFTEGGSNIKIKYQTRSNGKWSKKVFTFKNNGNYIFGLPNLPTDHRADFTLIITEGEDDANTINANLQSFGYCAITGGSAAATFGESWLNLLKNQFKSVFCCFDADGTGHKMSLRNAQKYSLPFLEINTFAELNDCKDVSDIFQKHGTNKLKTVCDFGRKFKTTLTSENENILPHFADVLRLEIDTYLSDKAQYLELFLSLYPKLLLQSGTGTGKTTFVIELSKNTNFLQNLGVDQIIFAVPRTSLGDQTVVKKCREQGVNAVFIDGKADKNDLEAAANSPFSVWTYDQLPKAKKLLPNALLVVDELHKIVSDNSFRGDVCDNLFSVIAGAKRVLAMSATPIFELCLGSQLKEKQVGTAKDLLNFKLLQVHNQHTQVKDIAPIFYNSRKSQIDVVMHHVEQVADTTQRKSVIFLNDVKKLETVAELIDARFGEGAATILSSQKEAYCNEQGIYGNIKNGENLPQNLKFVLCTSFADCGVDFDFEVSSVAFFGKFNVADLTQGMARPRHKGLVNAQLNVYRYRAIDTDTIEAVFGEFGQKHIQKDSKKWQETALESFENTLKHALTRVNRLNEIHAAPTSEKKYLDETDDIFWNETTAEWQISYPSVFERYNRGISKQLTEYGYFWLIQQLDPTCQIHPPQYIEVQKHEVAHTVLATKKETVKTIEQTAFTVAADYRAEALEIVGRSTRDKELKTQISAEIALPQNISEAAQEVKTKFDLTGSDLQKAVSRRLELEQWEGKFRELRQKDISVLLIQLQKDSDFELFHNRLCVFDDLRNATDGRGTYRAQNARKLIEAVQNYKKQKRTKTLSAGELVKLVSQTLSEKLDLQRAKMRVSELFEFKIKLNSARKTVYEIGDKLTLSDVIEGVKKPKMDTPFSQ